MQEKMKGMDKEINDILHGCDRCDFKGWKAKELLPHKKEEHLRDISPNVTRIIPVYLPSPGDRITFNSFA
jgi:hypothetical protein